MSYSEISPVLVAPVVEANNRSRLQTKEKGLKIEEVAQKGSSVAIKADLLPNSLCDICKNSAAMGFMVEGLSVAANMCARLGETGAVPYLNIPVTPLYFSHTVKKVKKRLELAMTAAKVSLTDAFLYLIQAIEAVGGSIGALAQTVNASLQLFSLTQYVIIGLIFSFIMPRFLLATASLGMVGGILALCRNNYALTQFNQKKQEGVAQALAYLSGQRGYVKAEDAHSDKVAQEVLKHEAESAHQSHFLSGTFDTEKVERFFKSLDLTGHLKKVSGQIKEVKELATVEALIHDLLASEKSGAELLEKTISIYDQLADTAPPCGLEGFFQEILSKRVALRGKSKEFLSMAESDIRRELFNQAFSLFILALVITASSMMIANPRDPFAPSMLSMAANVLGMGMILRSSFISYKSKKEFEKFLEDINGRKLL